MYFYAGRILWPVLLVLGGCGLVWNSLQGLRSREGMYDADSTTQMTLASWLGVVVGLLMIVAGGWGLLRPFRLLF